MIVKTNQQFDGSPISTGGHWRELAGPRYQWQPNPAYSHATRTQELFSAARRRLADIWRYELPSFSKGYWLGYIGIGGGSRPDRNFPSASPFEYFVSCTLATEFHNTCRGVYLGNPDPGLCQDADFTACNFAAQTATVLMTYLPPTPGTSNAVFIYQGDPTYTLRTGQARRTHLIGATNAWTPPDVAFPLTYGLHWPIADGQLCQLLVRAHDGPLGVTNWILGRTAA